MFWSTSTEHYYDANLRVAFTTTTETRLVSTTVDYLNQWYNSFYMLFLIVIFLLVVLITVNIFHK